MPATFWVCGALVVFLTIRSAAVLRVDHVVAFAIGGTITNGNTHHIRSMVTFSMAANGTLPTSEDRLKT